MEGRRGRKSERQCRERRGNRKASAKRERERKGRHKIKARKTKWDERRIEILNL